MSQTTFENKCKILSDLWMRYRGEQSLEDFFEYNDISLPLAFLIDEKIITEMNEGIESFIDEAFLLFLGAMGTDDTGFDSLDDILVDYFQEDQ